MCIRNEEKINSENDQINLSLFRSSTKAFCIKCSKPVELKYFSQVVEILKTNYQEVYRLADAGELHQIHNRKGVVMICYKSLFDVFDTRQTMVFDPDIFKTNPI